MSQRRDSALKKTIIKFHTFKGVEELRHVLAISHNVSQMSNIILCFWTKDRTLVPISVLDLETKETINSSRSDMLFQSMDFLRNKVKEKASPSQIQLLVSIKGQPYSLLSVSVKMILHCLLQRFKGGMWLSALIW